MIKIEGYAESTKNNEATHILMHMFACVYVCAYVYM